MNGYPHRKPQSLGMAGLPSTRGREQAPKGWRRKVEGEESFLKRGDEIRKLWKGLPGRVGGGSCTGRTCGKTVRQESVYARDKTSEMTLLEGKEV